MNERRLCGTSSVLCAAMFAGVIPYASVRADEPLDIDRVLQAAETDEAKLLDTLVRAGPVCVRSLERDPRRKSLSDRDSRRLSRILRKSRARLLGVNSADCNALTLILKYDGGRDAGEMIATLERILEAGAAETDFGRAEVLRALLHVYKVLHAQTAAARSRREPRDPPDKILRSIVTHEVGPEETRILDESIHLLLFHGWISNIHEIEVLIFRLIGSKYLDPELYEVLHNKILQTMEAACDPNEHLTREGQPTLSRSKPTEWPCLPHRLFMAIWDSPRATDAHRDALYCVLKDTMFSNRASREWELTCLEYLSWLRLKVDISREQIRAYIDNAVAAKDRDENTVVNWKVYNLFPDVCEACPHWRDKNSQPQWKDFKKWWQEGGRDAVWVPSFKTPHEARVVAVVEPVNEGDEFEILNAVLPIEAGEESEKFVDSFWGPYRVSIRAWPSPREKDVILFSGGPVLLPQETWSKSGGSRPYYVRVPTPERMRGGVHVRFNEGFVRRHGARNLRALIVLFIDEAPLEHREQIDFDWFFQKLRKELPAGTPLKGWSPGGLDEFLPTDLRMFLVRRFLEIVENPKYDPKRSPSYNSLIQTATFAFRQGDPYGRKALKTWTDNKWHGWKHVKEALDECERMIPADLATASPSDLLALLDDPDRWDHLLRLLLKPEVCEDLSPEERDRLARGLVRRMLAVETREPKQFVVVVVLRKLTGKAFGYEPFGEEHQRVEAVRKWVNWAGK